MAALSRLFCSGGRLHLIGGFFAGWDQVAFAFGAAAFGFGAAAFGFGAAALGVAAAFGFGAA